MVHGGRSNFLLDTVLLPCQVSGMEEQVTTGSTEDAAAKEAVKDRIDPASCARPGCEGCAELYSQLRVAVSERAYWRKMHAKAQAREGKLRTRVAALEAKLRSRERQIFGKKTERGGGGKGKGGRPPETKPEGKRPRGQQKGTKGHGRRTQDALGKREEFLDLDESDRLCADCGGLYEDTGLTEDSEVVEVEVKAHRRLIRRRRYRRSCDCPGPPRTLTAPPAPKLIPKGAYGASFWILVLLDKFLFQRPTHRLLAFLRLSVGLTVSPGTVTGGLERLVPLFKPLYDAILAKNISDTRWHADETRWMVFATVEGKEGHRWYLWVFRSETTIAFRLDPSRSAKVPKSHFGEHAKGILSVDRYSAYKTLLSDGKIVLAFCWAHVRRDFLDIAKDWPQLEAWGLVWVERIGELYALNKKRLAVLDDPVAFPDAQRALVAGIDAMKAERDAQLATETLHPACHKVLDSLKRHWSGLVVFVAHPEVPMDNSQAERDLRNPVIGRKNFRGSGAVWAGQLLVMAMSLFQTLLAWGVDPRLWLLAYFERCAELGGVAPDDAVRWLPWNLDEDELFELRPLASQPLDTS